MIEITLTIFVQAIHFFIAYILLRYLFLQPALLLLVEHQDQRSLLKRAIQVARKRVAHQQKIKDDCHAMCRNTFATTCRDIESTVRESSAYRVQAIDPARIIISPHELKRKEEQAESLLLQQLEKSD